METNDLLQQDLAKAKQVRDELPENIGVITIKTANRTIKDARLKPNPTSLWDNLWMQGELCCLYAESGAGKTIYAFQMASEIAKNHNVLYFDFELSDKQFQMRYTNEDGESFDYPDTLWRAEMNQKEYKLEDTEMDLINNIRDVALQYKADVLIIDNLTWICCNAEKSDVAGAFMKAMCKLKMEYGFSILILAHTRKRNNLCYPISPDDLAGSKRLFNFFDSAFTIGKSAKDEGWRYIKQTKVRAKEFTYTANNALLCEIVKDGSMLQFKNLGITTESEHLTELSEADKIEKEMEIIDYKKKNPTASIRNIAVELNVSFSNVQRTLAKNKQNNK